MKRFISVVTALVMLLALSIPAMAANIDDSYAIAISKRPYAQKLWAYKVADITAAEPSDTNPGETLVSYDFNIQDGSNVKVAAFIQAVEATITAIESESGETATELRALQDSMTSAAASRKNAAFAVAAAGFVSGAVTSTEVPDISYKWNYNWNKVFLPAYIDYLTDNQIPADATWDVPASDVKDDYFGVTYGELDAGYYVFVQKPDTTSGNNTDALSSHYMSGNVGINLPTLFLSVKNAAPTIEKGYGVTSYTHDVHLCEADVGNTVTGTSFPLSSSSASQEIRGFIDSDITSKVNYMGTNTYLTNIIRIGIPKELAVTAGGNYPILIHDVMEGQRWIEGTVSAYIVRGYWIWENPELSTEEWDSLYASLLANTGDTDSIMAQLYKIEPDKLTTYIASDDTIEDGCTIHFVTNLNLKHDLSALPERPATAPSNATFVPAEDIILYVEYDSELTADAVSNAPNYNTAWLSYSSNPYWTPEDGETPWTNTPEVFSAFLTSSLIVNKVDSEGKSLPGARFTLERAAVVDPAQVVSDPMSAEEEIVTPYGLMGSDKELIDGTGNAHLQFLDGIDECIRWTPIALDATRSDITNHTADKDVDLANISQFSWSYLPAGLYKLTEAEAPSGYYGTEPRYFVVGMPAAEYSCNDCVDLHKIVEIMPVSVDTLDKEDGTVITHVTAPKLFNSTSTLLDDRHSTLTESNKSMLPSWDFCAPAKYATGACYTKVSASGDSKLSSEEIQQMVHAATMTVVNTKGARLPETGGMGTTAIYVGGLMAITLAGFVLLKRKEVLGRDV